MRINPISNSTTFSGIWTESKSFYSDEFNYIDHTTKNYYPFKDETPEMIRKKAGMPYEDKYLAEWYETGDARVDTSESLVINKPLSFTEAEYNDYRAARYVLPQAKKESHNLVEKGLKDRGLSHLIWQIGDWPEAEPQNLFKRIFSKLKKGLVK